MVTEYLVVRRGDRAAVLARSTSGLPYCYLGQRLVLFLDRQNPGVVLMAERGFPVLRIGTVAGGERADFWVGQDIDADKPAITFDAHAILASALAKQTSAALDGESGALTITTGRSQLVVTPARPGENASLPIRGFRITSESGAIVDATGISADEDPPVDILTVTATAVAKTGLTVRARQNLEPLKLPMVPPTFGAEKPERDAAERLRPLFPETIPAAARDGSIGTKRARPNEEAPTHKEP
jgi:hypothetical protein